MTEQEELEQVRQENKALRETLRRKDEELEQSQQANQDLREGLKQAIMALGHRTSRGRKTVSGLLPPDTSAFPDSCCGSCPVWDRYPDIGSLCGGRPIRSLCPCEPIVARAAGSPTLGRQHCHLCQNVPSA